MIIEKNGKNNSLRTLEEEEILLQNDIQSLTIEERILLNKMIEDYHLYNHSALKQKLSKLSYDRPVVPIREFLDNPYYLGSLSKSLFPKLKDDLVRLFDGDFDMSMFGGSLGAGKSTAAVVAFMRVLYEISCMTNPHETFQIAPNDYIGFAVVALNQNVAQGIIDSKIDGIIKDSQYFQKEFAPINRKDGAIYFPKKLMVPPGASNEGGTIGSNIICALMDEVNFFKIVDSGEGVKDYAYDLYKSLKTRMDSRFRTMGKLPGMIIMVSSKKNVNSLTERVLKENIDNKRFFVVENATYEVVHQERFSGEKFRVAVGNENSMSRILAENEQDPDGCIVIEVPVEYRSSFEADIDQALRDISGVATIAVTPFISRRSKIIEAVDKTRVHPFSEYIWQQDIPAKFNWDILCNKTRDNAFVPKINPSAPRFVHIDMSKNKDLTGISVVHIGGGKEVDRGGVMEFAPTFVVDFVLGIKAPPSGEIYQHEVRRLIYELSQHGFFIKKVTADTYQSLGTLQALKTQGYETDTLSVDRVGPYDYFKAALYEDRVSYYHHDVLLKELRELEKNSKTGKVDHPQLGSKDICDAMCGAIFSLSTSNLSSALQNSYQPTRTEYINDEQWVLGNDSIPVDNMDQTGKDHIVDQVKSKKKYELPFVMG